MASIWKRHAYLKLRLDLAVSIEVVRDGEEAEQDDEDVQPRPELLEVLPLAVRNLKQHDKQDRVEDNKENNVDRRKEGTCKSSSNCKGWHP